MVHALLAAVLLAAPAPEPSSCLPIAGQVTLSPIPASPGPPQRPGSASRAVWTGTELLRWSASLEAEDRPGVLAFTPGAQAWRRIPSPGLLRLGRPTLVWTAGRAVLWGGVEVGESRITHRGVVLDPATGTSRPTSLEGAPSPRQFHSAAVMGDRMLVFGGGGSGPNNGWSCDGAWFDPVKNAWSPLAAPPAEVCPDGTGSVLLAASDQRAVLVRVASQPAPQVRAAVYARATQRWVLGPPLRPGRPLVLPHPPAFGPDGAAYVVAAEEGRLAAPTLYRIDPDQGRFEVVGPVCEAGQVLSAGDQLLVVGNAASCLVDPVRRRCVQPMRALGIPGMNARELLVSTGDGFIAYGHGGGVVARFGSRATEAPGLWEAQGKNVRGGVLQESQGWCGGATPPPGHPRVDALPARELPLLIRRGVRNTDPKVVAEVRTDGDGLFAVNLAPGTYCVVEAERRAVRLRHRRGTPRDVISCLNEENARCLGVFTIPIEGDSVLPVVLRRKHTCFGPCFRGAPPP